MRNVPSLFLCWPAAVWNTNTNTNTYKYKDTNTNNIVHKSYSHPRAWELCPPLFCSSSNTNSIVWPHFVNNLHLLFFSETLTNTRDPWVCCALWGSGISKMIFLAMTFVIVEKRKCLVTKKANVYIFDPKFLCRKSCHCERQLLFFFVFTSPLSCCLQTS